MKGGKNRNSSLLSNTETPPLLAGDNDVNSEKPLEVEEQERDGGAEGGDKEQKNGGDEEDVGIQEGEAEEQLVDAEKPKLAEGYYEIETVRRKRIRKGKIQYLIKWRGWPETANTWEPVENLVTCYDVMDAFEESLQSGNQRSTRKRKRTHALTHSQIKKKQQQQKQQHSPVDATYNVPTVKVRITEEPVPSPPLASLNVIDHVDRNGSGLNNIEVDELANDNDLMLDSCVKEIEEKNELYLKLSELKGVITTKETCVEKGVIATEETCVEKGVRATKETRVEKGVMATKENCVEKGVMATKQTCVEKGVMETRQTSVEKGVMETRDTSVHKGVMATRETFVDKGLMETKETSVEKGVMATRETSVDKGVMATRETSVDKGLMATKEIPIGRSENGITREVSTANGTVSLQSGRQIGAKRRKSTSVRRFKQQATSGVVKDPHDAVANATSGHLVAFMREEIYDHGLVGNALGCNNKCHEFKDMYAITEIIKAMSYSAPNIANDLTDVSVTFLAKRSDGKEVMVDNKFMKANNPLLLISFYEKHLRHHHPQ